MGIVLDELRAVAWAMRAEEFRWVDVASYLVTRIEQLEGASRIRRFVRDGDPDQQVTRAHVIALLRGALDEARTVLADGEGELFVRLAASSDSLSAEFTQGDDRIAHVALPR